MSLLLGAHLQFVRRWHMKSVLGQVANCTWRDVHSGGRFTPHLSWCRNLHSRVPPRQANFGVCLDIDGVLARGYMPFPEASRSCQKLQGPNAKIQVPLAFVTNSVSPNAYKANKLREWLGFEVLTSQMVQAHGPLALYTHLHPKHTLLIGQGAVRHIAEEIGFRNVCTIEDVTGAYPLLDVADHEKRLKISQGDITETDFPPVEAILVLGEPKHWETCIQLVLDVLLTEGSPRYGGTRHAHQTIPVIACNMDLKYSHRATFERIANGAFLLCLEQIFKKFTGIELQYEALMGKPSVVTFRYAEHCISQQARHLGSLQPIDTMYMIGDNQQVDIAGANVYQNYIDTKHNEMAEENSLSIPAGNLLPQTVSSIHSILVKTGVYKHSSTSSNLAHQSHRDFPLTSDMFQPTVIVENVEEAVQYILRKEHCV